MCYKYFLKKFDSSLLKVFTIIYILCITFSVMAQSAFNRDDNYDFSGKHHLSAFGTDLNNFNLVLASASDFHQNFKLKITKYKLNIHAGLWALKYRVDMNNDGNWEQDWTTSDQKTVTHNYPEPQGLTENHTIKVEIKYSNTAGQTWDRTRYHQVTVYPQPRVFLNQDSDVFIQLRNEDGSSKIPVLFVEGFDPLNEKFPEDYYNLTWDLINNDLYPNGYEIFILNFHDGGRDIRLNAGVLIKALEKIHEVCPNYKIVVGGLSMGGPITRYALADKEDQGGSHDVGLFISYDSPQDGAHVSPGLQDWIKGEDPNDGAIGLLQDNLKSMAAKQMLRYNTYDPAHTFYNEFYGELNSLNGDGYPHKAYNVSVINGNLDATWGYESVGRHLMTLKINDALVHDVSAVRLDCGTGSMFTDITMRRYGDIFHIPFAWIYYELDIIFNPAYIPTWSGLDLVGTDINEITGDIISFDHSKFDDFVVQTTPLQHHELSTVTRNKIMDWLDLDFNIDVNYNLLNGGTTDPDNYQVNILHGLPIEVEPKSLNINGKQITYNFSNWEDDNTSNPRTFYTSHDISKTVTMKGHMVSNNARATGYNNARRIVLDNDLLHAVYEDNGDIWYTSSSDDGQTWSNEFRIAQNGSDQTRSWSYTNPVIAVRYSPYGNLVSVIYEIVLNDGGTIAHGVNLREKHNTGWGWEQTVFETGDGSYIQFNDYSIPIMFIMNDPGSIYDQIVVIAKKLSNGKNYLKTSSGNFFNELEIPNTNGNLTGFVGQAGSNNDLYLVWSHNGDIKWMKGSNYYGSWNWSSVVNLTAHMPWYITDHQMPSFTVKSNSTKAYLTWVGNHQHLIFREVYFQEYDNIDNPTPSGTLTTFCYDDMYSDYGNPSMSYESASNKVTVFYEKTGKIYRNSKTGASWTAKNFSSGRYPSISIQSDNGAIWTKYTSAPYIIKSDYIPPPPINKVASVMEDSLDEMELIIHKRFDFELNDKKENSSFISLKLAATNVNEKTVEFDDSNKGNSLVFSGSDNISMHWETVAKNIGSDVKANTKLIDVYLVEGQKRTLLETYRLADFIYDEDSKKYETSTSFYYSALDAKKAYLEIDFPKYQPMITNILEFAEPAADLPKKSILSYNPEIVPHKYELMQNYPNPFNPVTHIQFGLPEAGEVSVKVYNTQGQQVAELINGHQQAGTYEVVFDASGLASGLYFYKLDAGNFSQVKRMLLVK